MRWCRTRDRKIGILHCNTKQHMPKKDTFPYLIKRAPPSKPSIGINSIYKSEREGAP